MTLFFQFHFYLFGLIAIGSALLFVTRQSPVAAALWLVNTMFSLAALYVMLHAEFIGAIQILVYAGAIMVVFLFVIMLLNLGHPSEIADLKSNRSRLIAGAAGITLLALLLTKLRQDFPLPFGARLPEAPPLPNPLGAVGPAMFYEHVLAFEVAGVLLLAAIIAAVVLAKRRTA